MRATIQATRRGYMVRGETDEETNDLKTRHCVARYVEACLMHQNAKKSSSGLSRNQNSIMLEDCVGFTSFDPEDEEFKDIMKNAHRKLEIQRNC